MHTKLLFAAVALSATLLTLLPYGDAECCGKTRGVEAAGWGDAHASLCEDCSKPSGYYCAAGSGGCNMFGCNCEGGCKRRVEGNDCRRKKRDVPVGNVTGHDTVKEADFNKDGRLDELEVKIFLTRHGLPVDGAWRALDADGDNHLTAYEIDDDLKPTAMAV